MMPATLMTDAPSPSLLASLAVYGCTGGDFQIGRAHV